MKGKRAAIRSTPAPKGPNPIALGNAQGRRAAIPIPSYQHPRPNGPQPHSATGRTCAAMRALNFDARYDRAIRVLDHTVTIENPARRKAVFDILVREAEQIVALRPEDANANYLAGLCWYDHPESSQNRSRLVKLYLERAMRLDPGHQFARVFLAYHHYDERRYQESLACLASLDYGAFANLGQSWRNLKSDELKLACRLSLCDDETPLSQMESLAGQIDQLAVRYASTAPEDAAVPIEIVRSAVIAINTRRRSQTLMRLAAAMARLIEDLGYTESLRAEYATLRQYAVVE
jgi:hypothetical protein